jgi:integrase
LEITTLLQAINYFIDEDLLPSNNKIVLPIKKPTDSDTYCYTAEQVEAMLSFCRASKDLEWLAEVILGLAATGMRISELAALKWDAVDFKRNIIEVKDERRSGVARRRTARTTKSGKSRNFPIQEDLKDLLLAKAEAGAKGFVFHAPKGGALRANNVREALVNHVITSLSERFPSSEDEIGFKDGRLHSLRHFFRASAPTAKSRSRR